MTGRFVLLDRPALDAAPEGRDGWLVPYLLPESGTTIVYGVPGEGKSTICMEMALALENGTRFCDSEEFDSPYVGQQVPTAWLSFEDDWEYEARGRLRRHTDITRWPTFIAEPSGESFTDATSLLLTDHDGDKIAADVAELWHDLGRQLQEAGIRVLFIDTVSELVGTDATARYVREVFRFLGKLRDRFAFSTVLIGHASAHKDGQGRKKEEIMGSTDWTAKARHTILVDGNTKNTWARAKKSNRGETGFNVLFEKVDGGPLTLVRVNSQREYIERTAKSDQERDWEAMRAKAKVAHSAGAEFWKNLTALGAATGGSKKIGQNLVRAGFFKAKGGPGGGYVPNLALINSTDGPPQREALEV